MGERGEGCWGSEKTSTLPKSEISHTSLRWQQNQTTAVPGVDCNSKVLCAARDHLNFFWSLLEVCWQWRSTSNTGAWVSLFFWNIPNLSVNFLSLSSSHNSASRLPLKLHNSADISLSPFSQLFYLSKQ